MARQSTTPVMFQRTKRQDSSVLMSSGRAGKVVPCGYIPVLRGDSASGKIGIDVELAEMPRPTLNAVIGNFQAWFVPKSAAPQFSGYDEFMHSYQGEQIKALGQTDRDPPVFFNKIWSPQASTDLDDSEFFKTLGIHRPADNPVQTDLIDAFNLVYNFRLAAHSSRLERRQYATEDAVEATTLPRAFWPSGRFSKVVPDYERALIVGALDLDVAAGQVPISGLGWPADGNAGNIETILMNETGGGQRTVQGARVGDTHANDSLIIEQDADNPLHPNIFGELTGQSISVTLADIDNARKTAAFAKLRSAMAGNDATGFDNDDAIVAELMQGFNVPEDQFKRPWLLDSARVPFGMVERHATDAGNLDQSVSQGRASATLSLNVPVTDVGGIIIVTFEVLPERLDERQTDEFLHLRTTADLPDALRDVQRPEPVDVVKNRRLDARHSDPEAGYGFELMNDVWNRSFTRLGGAYYQADPLNPWTEQRSAIWQTSIVDPTFTTDHYLCPEDFPHDVFADELAPAFEFVARHNVAIAGITQFGDILAENNDDYAAIAPDV